MEVDWAFVVAVGHESLEVAALVQQDWVLAGWAAQGWVPPDWVSQVSAPLQVSAPRQEELGSWVY